jgi:hypothetical protein
MGGSVGHLQALPGRAADQPTDRATEQKKLFSLQRPLGGGCGKYLEFACWQANNLLARPERKRGEKRDKSARAGLWMANSSCHPAPPPWG